MVRHSLLILTLFISISLTGCAVGTDTGEDYSIDNDNNGVTEALTNTLDDEYAVQQGALSSKLSHTVKASSAVSLRTNSKPNKAKPNGPSLTKFVNLSCGESYTRKRGGLGFWTYAIASSKFKASKMCQQKLKGQAQGAISCNKSSCGTAETCEPKAELLKKWGNSCSGIWDKKTQKYSWRCQCHTSGVKYSCTECAEPEEEQLEYKQKDPKRLSHSDKAQQ